MHRREAALSRRLDDQPHQGMADAMMMRIAAHEDGELGFPAIRVAVQSHDAERVLSWARKR